MNKKEATAAPAETLVTPRVLELLASRICHDLISPVGAVSNGIEFLEETGTEGGQDAINLISHSAKQAGAKLEVFRLIYGAGGSSVEIKPDNVYNSMENLVTAEGKVSQDWDPKDPLGFEERPDGYCKILAGVLLLGMECLPRGGTLKAESGGDNVTLVTASGDNAAPRAQVRDALAQNVDEDDLDPRLVHPYVLGILAQHYGVALSIEPQDGRVLLKISGR